jgi:MYXO-CTERM domain-containing protein
MRRFALVIVCTLLFGAIEPHAAAAVGDSNVSMNVHNGTQAFVDASSDLGLGWVRLDGNWQSMEPSDDNYQWGPIESAITAANAAGLRVYLSLAYTPDWVPRHGDTNGNSNNDIPNTSTEWVDFVTDAVNHYSASPYNVTHFGMWNEPNLTQFFEGGESSVGEYASIILVPGAAAVRGACSSCQVLGPDLAHVGDVDDYMEALFALIPTSTFDIFAHHIYGGFEETGKSVWDGDRFFNSLDQQRFKGTPLEAFTRRSMRDLLDGWGWTGEVWITETGYKANVGDAADEDLQAVYVRRVLEEQLLRDWYTNTFFYEINDCGVDQPGCTIDGFGLMRPESGSPGSRTFPSDFRLKPAFLALKQFLVDNPQVIGTGPSPACSDGVDNDGDGFADVADRGCDDAFDTDESDDPPRTQLQALAADGITVDGDLSDFGSEGWVQLSLDGWQSTGPLGTGDLEVLAAGRFAPEGLYLAFEVTDDTHDNSQADADLWQGDSIQLGFDVAQSGGASYDDVDDHEINFALVGGAARSFRFKGPSGADDSFSGAITRSGSVTSYEIFLPAAALPGANFALGQVVGFSFLVNDADGSGREGWLEWTPGIGGQKAPYYFGEVAFVDMITPPPGTGGGGPVPTGAGAGAATSGAGGAADPADDSADSGCGCRVAGRPASTGALSVAFLLLAFAMRRRRKRS